eukprot:Clim_evm5s44 gene=Clim_evmTU5s44
MAARKKAASAGATSTKSNGKRKAAAALQQNGDQEESIATHGHQEQELLVHRCRFVDYTPQAINSLAVSPDNAILAIARAGGIIEFWSIADDYAPMGFIARSPAEAVEGLAWITLPPQSKTQGFSEDESDSSSNSDDSDDDSDSENDSDNEDDSSENDSSDEEETAGRKPSPKYRRSKPLTREEDEEENIRASVDDADGLPRYRLFGCRLDGYLVEIDHHSLRILQTIHVTGGPAWCVAAAPVDSTWHELNEEVEDAVHFAVGSEDGRVRVFAVKNPLSIDQPCDVQFHCSLAPCETRVMSLSWYQGSSNILLAAGTAGGSLHISDVARRQEVIELTVEGAAGAGKFGPQARALKKRRRRQREREGRKTTDDEDENNDDDVEGSVVWCTAWLPAGSDSSQPLVACGDSQGFVSVFDINNGTTVQRFRALAADVLTLQAVHDGSEFLLSGVDSQLVLYRLDQAGMAARSGGNNRATSAGKAHWVLSSKQRSHSHDVRAMALATDARGQSVAITGGVDCQVIVSCLSLGGVDGMEKAMNLVKSIGTARKIPPFPPYSVVHGLEHASRGSLAIVRLDNRLQVFSLRKILNTPSQIGESEVLWASNYKKPLQLLEWRSKDEAIIQCMATDPVKNRVLVSTSHGLRIFRLVDTGEDLSVMGTTVKISSGKVGEPSKLLSKQIKGGVTACAMKGNLVALGDHEGNICFAVVGTNLPSGNVPKRIKAAVVLDSDSIANDALTALYGRQPCAVVEIALANQGDADGANFVAGGAGGMTAVDSGVTVGGDDVLVSNSDDMATLMAVRGQGSRSVSIYSLTSASNGSRLVAQTPVLDSLPTAMGFVNLADDCDRLFLVVATASRMLHVFDCSQGGQRCAPLEQYLNAQFKAVDAGVGLREKIYRLIHYRGSLYVVDHSRIVVAALPTEFSELFVDVTRSTSAKRRKGEPEVEQVTTVQRHNARACVLQKYRPLIGVAHLPSNDIVVIERPWLSIMERLPPTLSRRRYGT